MTRLAALLSAHTTHTHTGTDHTNCLLLGPPAGQPRPRPEPGASGTATRNRGRAGEQVAPRGAQGPASTTPGSLEREQRWGRGATCGQGTVAGAPQAAALLPWAAPGHRSPEPLRPWGGRPGGPVPHLRLVPTETDRPNTANLGGEAGQRDCGGWGASGPQAWGRRAQSACLSGGCHRGAGLTWGSPGCPLLFPAPSCFPGIPKLQTQRVWDSGGLPLAAVTSDPGHSVLTEAVCCYSSEGQKVKMGLAGLKSWLGRDCPTALGECLVPCS